MSEKVLHLHENVVSINEAFNLLNELYETSGLNAKKEILKRGIDNKAFRKMLLYANNTYWTYNIRTIPDDSIFYEELDNEKNPVSALRFYRFFNLLDKLRNREITGNEAMTNVISLLSECNDIESTWYMAILFKDLGIGATEKTINKVYGKDFIPVFDCMLAMPYRSSPSRYVILFKMDGYRALAFHDLEGNVTLISRNGKQYFGFDDVEDEIKKLPRGYIYDGELMAKDKTFSGIQRQGTRKAKGKDANFYLFDCIPIEDFDNAHNEQDWFERRLFLHNALKDKGLKHVFKLKSYGVYEDSKESDAKVDKLYELALKLGYEGLIMVDVDSTYQFRKGYHWQKLKPYETFDLEVVDMVLGRPGTKYSETLGAFIVDFNGVHVRVGSGIIDYPNPKKPYMYSRDYLWENRASFIGGTIEVRAGEVTDNLTGLPSLRFPRFRGFRHDK